MAQHHYYLHQGGLQSHYPYSEEMHVPFDERRTPALRIFVTQLPYEATHEDLENYFKQFGNVIDTYLPRQPENPALNRGYGFVSFDDEGDVTRVLQMPSHVICGRGVIVDHANGGNTHSATPRTDSDSQGYYDTKGSMGTSGRYAGSYTNYSFNNDDTLPIVGRYHRRDRGDQERYYSGDHGRENYAPPGAYSRKYHDFDPHKPVSYVFSGSVRSNNYGGVDREPSYPTRSSNASRSRMRPVPKLFVGRLSQETTVHALRSYFSQFGEVVDAYIPRDSHTHRSKGFGFLTFAHKNALHAVLDPNAKHYLGGREIVVDFADNDSYRN